MLAPMKRLVSAFCAVAMTAAASGALALDGDDSDEQVDALYKRGDAAAESNDWQGAYDAYLQAWKLRKTFDIATNLGMTELRLGKPRAAAQHLAEALDSFPPSQRGDRRQKVRELLQRAKNLVATLKLDVRPAKAQLFLDDEKLGAAEDLPNEIYVEPGKRKLEVRLAGYDTAQKIVEAEIGRQYQLGIELNERLPSSGLEHPGKGGSPGSKARSPLPIYIGAGLALAGIGSGVVFTLVANARENDAARVKGLPAGDAGCVGSSSKACAQLRQIYEDVDTDNDVAHVGFAVGVISTAALITYVMWPSSTANTQSHWRATPVFSAHSGGLFVDGRF